MPEVSEAEQQDRVRLPSPSHDYAFAMHRSGQNVWIGWYGGSLTARQQHREGASPQGIRPISTESEPPRLPGPRQQLTAQQVQAMLRHFTPMDPQAPPTMPEQERPSRVAELMPDWRTQGDWLGRYGESMGVCAAMAAPYDRVSGPRSPWFYYKVRLGEHIRKGDSTRYWVHWLTTEDRRSLMNKVNGGRRQSSWDDHGEGYDLSHEGPHLYIDLKTPPGLWRVSLYFFNKDGHTGRNRFRDYVVSIRDAAETEATFAASPEHARARVEAFRGGVWKRFALEGGRSYTIRIDRNWSQNAICSGLFVDPIVDPSARPPQKRYFGLKDAQGRVELIDPSVPSILIVWAKPI
jgi:hypothetical protein